MIAKLLNEHHLEFLRLKGGCRGLSESTLVKMSNCWKSRAAAQIMFSRNNAQRNSHKLTHWYTQVTTDWRAIVPTPIFLTLYNS